MNDFKHLEVVLLKDMLNINNDERYNVKVYFIRNLKNGRCTVQVSGVILNVDINKLEKIKENDK